MSDHIPREYLRSACDTPIQYALGNSSRFRCSRTRDYSPGGLCIEVDQRLAPEAEVCVVMERYAPDQSGPGRYRSYLTRIRWSRPRLASRGGGFVAGAQIMACSHEVLIAPDEALCHTCDFCGALMKECRLHGSDESAQLCEACHQHCGAIPDGKINACVERFLIGNVV
jgi:hypothetical protein